MAGPVESDDIEVLEFRDKRLVGICSAPEPVNKQNGSTSLVVALSFVEKLDGVARYIPR